MWHQIQFFVVRLWPLCLFVAPPAKKSTYPCFTLNTILVIVQADIFYMFTGLIEISLKKKMKARERDWYKQCYVVQGARSCLVWLRWLRWLVTRGNMGGFSSYFTSNLLRQKNLVGCTAQPGTDKAVRRNSFERQLSQRLTVLCTRNFEGLRESYGPIPSVLKLDCVKDRHPGYSRQVKCFPQVFNSCRHVRTHKHIHAHAETSYSRSNPGWTLLQTI